MSSTDRFEVLRRPCTCGKGEYVIEHCSPDHPWVRAHQHWWEGTITCPDCSAEFDLLDQSGTVVRVKKTDVAATKKKEDEWHAKLREMEKHADAQGHYDAIGHWLSSFPSVAATFRALRGIVSPTSEGTFRKRFSPTKEWVKREVFYQNLPKALKAIGRSDPVLDQLVKESEAIWNIARSGPPILEAVYKAK